MKVHRGDAQGVVITATHAELMCILCALDAADRNYMGVPAEISDLAAQSMMASIDAIRAKLEKFQ